MEEGAGDAGGDGDEVALALEDFDLGRARVVGEIDGASAADAGSGEVVGGDRGKVRKKLARVDEEGAHALHGSESSENSRFLHFASLSHRES